MSVRHASATMGIVARPIGSNPPRSVQCWANHWLWPALVASDAFGCATALIAGHLVAASLAPLAGASSFGLGLAVDPDREFVAFSLILLLCLHAADHYRQRHLFEIRNLLGVLSAAVCGFVITHAILFEQSPAISQVFALVGLPLWLAASRFACRVALGAIGLWKTPVLVVGDDSGAKLAARLLTAGALRNYVVAGSVDVHGLQSSNHVDWSAMLERAGAERLVLVRDDGHGPNQVVVQSVLRGCVPFMVIEKRSDLPVSSMQFASGLASNTVVSDYRVRITNASSRALKAAFDVVVAGALVAALAPLMALIAIIVRRDGGPALFAHERIGANGSRFNCLKFRSMVTNSADVLADVLANDPAARREWLDKQKLTNDPRITTIGRFLRKTSLDELPQLFNVLRREMSLVGPRPIVENEISRYGADIEYYFKTRPGLTGLWQVSGRSNTSYGYRVELDRWYVKNWSLARDMVIMFRTFSVVLNQHGAR